MPVSHGLTVKEGIMLHVTNFVATSANCAMAALDISPTQKVSLVELHLHSPYKKSRLMSNMAGELSQPTIRVKSNFFASTQHNNP
jgi:hypothetical protein